MSTHQGLAERVAALRQRLEEIGHLPRVEVRQGPNSVQELQQLRRELQHIEQQNFHLDARLAELCPELLTEPDSEPLPSRFAWKPRRLLLQVRELLEDLKSLADLLPAESKSAGDPVAEHYRRTAALAELALR